MKNEKLPNVSIIITNFKDVNNLDRCLESVFQIDYPNFEVLVIDVQTKNIGDIKKKYPSTRIIHLDSDPGFVAIRNIGIKHVNQGCRYILFLDNDTEVTSSLLRKLVKTAESNESIGIVNPIIMNLKDKTKIHYFGINSDIFGVPIYITALPRAKSSQGIIDFFFTSGCAMLIKKDLMNKIGLFDVSFYFGVEDFDFSWRAKLAGYRIVTNLNAIVYHKQSGTRKRGSLKRMYYGIRNTLRMLVKNYDFATLLVIAPLYLLKPFVEMILFMLVKTVFGQRSTRLSSIPVNHEPLISLGLIYLKAIKWNVYHLKGTLRLRQKIQHFRKVSDRKILCETKWKRTFLF